MSGMKRIKRFPVFMGIFFFLLCSLEQVCTAQKNRYEDFSQKPLIRFHIRAESNEDADQEEKMAVREDVLRYIKACGTNIKNKQEMREFVLCHREEIEEIIQKRMLSYHKNPVISIYFTKEFFPMRKYGQTIVPAGIYEALRIDLGKAQGKNWWCVLYPGVCLIDSEHVLENPEDQKKLEKILYGERVKIKYKSFFSKVLHNFSKK